MNFKTMHSYLMLGAKVRHVGWVAKTYLGHNTAGYYLGTPSGDIYFENLERYKPEYIYNDKYVEGWELYELQNNEGTADNRDKSTP